MNPALTAVIILAALALIIGEARDAVTNRRRHRAIAAFASQLAVLRRRVDALEDDRDTPEWPGDDHSEHVHVRIVDLTQLTGDGHPE